MSKESPKKLLISDERVQAALAVARVAQKEYVAKSEEFSHLLDPVAYAKAHERFITEADSADAIEFALIRLGASTIGGLPSPRAPQASRAAIAAQQRAAALINQAFEPFKATIAPLIDAGKEVLAELRKIADQADADYHAEWGIPKEATGVSRRLDSLAATLEGFSKGLMEEHTRLGSHTMPTNVYCTMLDFFATE